MSGAVQVRFRVVECPHWDCRARWTDLYWPDGWSVEERDRLLAEHERLAHLNA